MSIQFYTSKAYEAFQGALPTLIPAAKSAARWGAVATTVAALEMLLDRDQQKYNAMKLSKIQATLIVGAAIGVGRFTFCLSSFDGNFQIPAFYSCFNVVRTAFVLFTARDEGIAAASLQALNAVIFDAAVIGIYNRHKIADFLRSN